MAFTPQEVLTHYGLENSVPTNPGQGQKIGIANLYGTVSAADLETLKTNLGLQHPITWKTTGIINPGAQSDHTEEILIDMSIIGSYCPYAEIYVYQAPTNQQSNSSIVNAFTSIINAAVQDNCTIISISFGKSEVGLEKVDLTGFNSAISAAKKASINVLAATGDFGSQGGIFDNKASVLFPSSHPDVIAVGGTTINGQNEEVAWTSGGGGISSFYKTLPNYQSLKGFPTIDTAYQFQFHGPTKTVTVPQGRIVPDVSAMATGWDLTACVQSIPSTSNWGGTSDISGTSLSTPFWASLIAWCNQNAGASITDLQFYLYQYMVDKKSPAMMNDIVNGDDNYALADPRIDYFKATKGFDACTGWGTPNANFLLVNDWLT